MQADLEKVDYVNLLRESCLVVFMSLVQSFREPPEQRALLQLYLPKMTQLIQSIAMGDAAAHDENLLVSAISLVGDLITAFGTDSIPLMDSEPVATIVNRLRRSRQTKCKTALNWVSREMQRVRRQVV